MTGSLVRESTDFIMNNILNIILMVLFITIYTGFVLINGLLEKKTKPKLKRVVIIENLSNQSGLQETLKNGFCRSTLSDNKIRQKNCKQLSRSNCNAVECCVYAKQQGSNTFNCVAGDQSGPTFITNPPTDEYYYLGKLRKQ